MDKKLKLKNLALAIVEEGVAGHLVAGIVGMAGDQGVDLGEIVGIRIGGMIVGEAEEEPAITAIGQVIWQEIVLKVTAGVIAGEVVDLEAVEVGEAGHATIATERGIWRETAQKEIEGIEEEDNLSTDYSEIYYSLKRFKRNQDKNRNRNLPKTQMIKFLQILYVVTINSSNPRLAFM